MESARTKFKAKVDAVFKSAKEMLGGRERRDGIILKDLEE